MHYSVISSALVALAISLSTFVFPAANAQDQVVNVYSSRHYQTDDALYAGFTAATGIQVNRIEGNGNTVLERIRNEGANSPADVYVAVDAGRLWYAEEDGLFASVSSTFLEARIPENLRHPEGRWFGFSTRARVIFYNRELIDPANLQTYESLADPALKGEVCIRASDNIYNQSLLASLIEVHGVERAEEWARGVVANFARDPQGGDTDQLRGVASGECGVAVANTYYYARLMRSDTPEDQDLVRRVGVVFPNQDGRGAHVNIAGAGVLEGSPNRENAIRFLEYLASDQAQRYFADGNNEYPVVEGLLDNPALEALGDFKIDAINVSVYGRNQAEAQRIFDRAGWK